MDAIFGNTFFKQSCFDRIHEWRWSTQQVLGCLVSDFIVLEYLIDFSFIEKAALIGKEWHQTEIRKLFLKRLQFFSETILITIFQTPDQYRLVRKLKVCTVSNIPSIGVIPMPPQT